ncbi:MAG: alpha/beta fold hydrolase [Actinomycetota bacterium]
MPRFESFDGTQLSYEIDGDGVPVLFLHGFASDSFINWVRPGVIDAVARAGFRAFALDQRGHGLSDKPHEKAAYADAAMVRDARGLLDHLEMSRCLCVGFSMGAMNTVGLIKLDDRIKAAVLGGVGSHTLLARAEGGNFLADAMLAEDKSTITNPIAKSFRDFADLTRADKKALAAIQDQARPPMAGLESLDIPVLVLGASNDPLAGDPQALADKIPGAKSVTVGGTHLNVVNNPEFHTALVDFLNEHRGLAEAIAEAL